MCWCSIISLSIRPVFWQLKLCASIFRVFRCFYPPSTSRTSIFAQEKQIPVSNGALIQNTHITAQSPQQKRRTQKLLSLRDTPKDTCMLENIFGLCCPFTVMSCLGGQIPARGLVASGLMHASSLEPIFRVLGSYCIPYHGTAVWSRDYKSCRLYKRYNCTTGHFPGCCF